MLAYGHAAAQAPAAPIGYAFQGRFIRLVALPDQAYPAIAGHPARPVAPSSFSPAPERAYLDPAAGLRMAATGRVIVLLDRSAPGEALLGRLAGAFPVRPLRNLKVTDAYLLETEGDPLRIAGDLRGAPGVIWAEPDFRPELRPAYIPDDPLFPKQQHLLNGGQNGAKGGADLRAPQAWDICWDAGEVTVAVFDDGIEKHPDLAIAPGGKNYIDEPPSDDVSPQPNASGHGNSCAGLIGALGNNGIGVVGVAPGAKVMPMRVTNYPDDGFASNANFAEAILDAADHADAGSVSIIGMTANVIDAALKQAAKAGRRGKGFLFFSSAGNGGNGALTYPSLYESSVPVGAATDGDVRADYSQWGAAGKTVEFLAPSSGGRNGITTVDRLGAKGFASGDYTTGFGGTSAATPIAAGVAALILAVNPDLTRVQVLEVMRSTCDRVGPLPYVAGVNPEYGHGRLNAFEALKKVPPYISAHPRDTAAATGGTAYFAIAARGYQLRYRWQRLRSDGSWEDVPLAVQPIFSLPKAVVADSGSYRCIAANANGSDTSATASLRIRPASGLRASPAGSPLRMEILPDAADPAFTFSVPADARVRLRLIDPLGRAHMVVDQFLAAGRYRIESPYRFRRGGAYAFLLTAGGSTLSGKWVVP